ncbi:MAG: superinfection immunity protein [Dehalococcoidaceae bacterium]|nr:superinfection immunity protein [Dehalococcoidaceae bacterium]
MISFLFNGVGIIFFILGLLLYFLPTILAVTRKHPNTLAIFLLNFFLGWSFIGWVVALVWSVKN